MYFLSTCYARHVNHVKYTYTYVRQENMPRGAYIYGKSDSVKVTDGLLRIVLGIFNLNVKPDFTIYED